MQTVDMVEEADLLADSSPDAIELYDEDGSDEDGV